MWFAPPMGCELDVWEKFKVSAPVAGCAPFKALADTRRALTWEMTEAKEDVKAW